MCIFQNLADLLRYQFFTGSFLLSFFCLGSVGCVNNPMSDWSINNNPQYPTEKVDFPPLGEVTQGELGRTLAAFGLKSERPGIRLLEPWNYMGDTDNSMGVPAHFMRPGIGKLSSRMTNLKTGEKLDCFSFEYYRTENFNYDCAICTIPKEGSVNLCRNDAGDFSVFQDAWQFADPVSYKINPFDAPYETVTVDELNGPTDVQEFLYAGRVGDALKFIYREYKNNYARPAFTQEVQYDLSQSDEIGFKNLRLKVLEATNTNITYKVIQNF